MMKLFLLSLIFLFSSVGVSANQYIDSLKKEVLSNKNDSIKALDYGDIAITYYRSGFIDSGLTYTSKAESIIINNNLDTFDFVKLFQNKISLLISSDRADEAIFLTDVLLASKEKIEMRTILDLRINKGGIYLQNSEYSKAAKYYSDLLDDTNLLKEDVVIIKGNIAISSISIGDQKNAQTLCYEIISLDSNDQLPYHILSHIHSQNKAFDSSLYYLDKIINDGDKMNLGNINLFNSKAMSYYETNKLNKAKLLLLKSRNFLINVEDNYGLKGSTYSILGLVYNKDKKYNISYQYYDTAVNHYNSSDNTLSLRGCHRNMAELSFNLSDSSKFNYHFNEFIRLSDSLNSKKKLEEYELAIVKYKTNEKENENKLLTAENKSIKAESVFKTRILILVFLIFILIVSLLYFIIRKRKDDQEIYQQKKELEELKYKSKIEEQNTEIKNLINSINSKESVLNELMSSSEFQETQTEKLLSKIEESKNQNTEWENIFEVFKKIHPSYISTINKQSESKLTHNETRLLILIKLGYSSKEIAETLFVTIHAVNKARQRLNKKIDVSNLLLN